MTLILRTLNLRPLCVARRTVDVQLVTAMGADPVGEAERAAKGVLFSRLVEALPTLLALRARAGELGV